MAKKPKPDYSDRIDPSVGRVPHDYTEISNPAAVGWRWISDGRDHELVWSRSTEPMMYSIKGTDGRWNHHPSRHPKMAGIAKLDDAREIAEWFINGHMLPENDSGYQ